jgi:hypothetical protein
MPPKKKKKTQNFWTQDETHIKQKSLEDSSSRTRMSIANEVQFNHKPLDVKHIKNYMNLEDSRICIMRLKFNETYKK